MRQVRVERSTGALVCVADVADGHWTRFWGLMGRKQLPHGLGLWITPCRSVHTFFMRLPIDLIFLSNENVVMKIRTRMRPGRLSFGGPGAKTVLELAAGALDSVPISTGEMLTIRSNERTSSQPGPQSQNSAAADERGQ